MPTEVKGALNLRKALKKFVKALLQIQHSKQIGNAEQQHATRSRGFSPLANTGWFVFSAGCSVKKAGVLL